MSAKPLAVSGKQKKPRAYDGDAHNASRTVCATRKRSTMLIWVRRNGFAMGGGGDVQVIDTTIIGQQIVATAVHMNVIQNNESLLPAPANGPAMCWGGNVCADAYAGAGECCQGRWGRRVYPTDSVVLGRQGCANTRVRLGTCPLQPCCDLHYATSSY